MAPDADFPHDCGTVDTYVMLLHPCVHFSFRIIIDVQFLFMYDYRFYCCTL